MRDREDQRLGTERRIGRLMIAITYVSVALLVVGVGLMLARGISPVAGGPGLDLSRLGTQVAELDPAGFLWLGLMAVIAAPISRVAVAGYAYARRGDRLMVAVAGAILAIIIVGIASAGVGSRAA